MERERAPAPHGCTIVLDTPATSSDIGYRDTALPFSGSAYRPAQEPVPERVRQLLRMFDYSAPDMEAKAAHFIRQARSMEDYKDDAPWPGGFFCYFPAYHDMTVAQLRGYFSWRADIRRGEYRPISTSAAYIYLYELLNGIGASSPEDTLENLRAFEAGYLDAGIGNDRMRRNLRRWMFEFTVINNLSPVLARTYAEPELLREDAALAALRKPDAHTDEDVFAALCLFGGQKLAQSPVLADDEARGRRLFSETWRRAAAQYRREEKSLFTLCFGRRYARAWHPLGNALYLSKAETPDVDYILNETRVYRCRDGRWKELAHDRYGFDRDRLRALLHETERLIRRYLGAGRALREKPEESWAAPYAAAAIEADRLAAREAARPRITLDLSGLDRIRRDAMATRDSLLTEAELSEPEDPEDEKKAQAFSAPIITAGDSPLDATQIEILHILLRGDSPRDLLREKRLLPSIAADAINDALYDALGDIAVVCEDDELVLTEDYAQDISELLGGMQS